MNAPLLAPSTTFQAPNDLIATEPPERRGLARDGVRLLVATSRGVTHARFGDLPDHLRPGDLLVVNTSATLPAELDGELLDIDADDRSATGRPIVVHLATDLGDGAWVVELRSSPRADRPLLDAQPGQQVRLPVGASLRLVTPYPRPNSSPTGTGNRLWRAALDVPDPMLSYLHRWGRPIAYGYLRGRFPLTAYQTIFSRHPGSAEMPSAARPFTMSVVKRLAQVGVGIASVVLHTGVSSQDAGEAPQPERFEVPEATARLVNRAHQDGGRVIAVGTTVTRALESARRDRTTAPNGGVEPARGWTDLVIEPSRGARVVDGLITGWHDPLASHLLLVEAIAGASLTQLAYNDAVAERYLWHEFGDSALLLP